MSSRPLSQVAERSKALTEPCVKLSLHTALRIPVKVSNRESNVRTYWALFLQVYEAKPYIIADLDHLRDKKLQYYQRRL